MSESRTRMIAALKEVIVPMLRSAGFSGSFPHYRRITESQIDLLTFQFSSWGGRFAVEVAYCSPLGVTYGSGEKILPKKATAHHILQRLRIGSTPPEEVDHWFEFESATHGGRTYQMVAEEVLKHLPQAERYWQSHEEIA